MFGIGFVIGFIIADCAFYFSLPKKIRTELKEIIREYLNAKSKG